MEVRGRSSRRELGSGVLALRVPWNEGRQLQRGAGLVPRVPLTLRPPSPSTFASRIRAALLLQGTLCPSPGRATRALASTQT